MKNQLESPTQWVLIRGLAREARHWGSFPELLTQGLADLGNAARVATIDLPGAGRFSEMRCPLSIAEMTEFMREKLNEIRQRQRESGDAPARQTYLVALSLGGMVASRWLEKWPEDFAGCVLINTSFKGVSPVHHRLRPVSLLHIFKAVRERDMIEREKHILRLISNYPDNYNAVAAEWAQIQLTRPVAIENFARQLIAASRFESQLETSPVPCLLLNSARDRMVHPSCSTAIAEKWGAELHCHPTAGHDLPLDEPEWVVEQIANWFRRLGER